MDRKRKQGLNTVRVISPSELDLAACGVAEQQNSQAQANLADAVTQLLYAKSWPRSRPRVESLSSQEGETGAATFEAPSFVTLLDRMQQQRHSGVCGRLISVCSPVLDAWATETNRLRLVHDALQKQGVFRQRSGCYFSIT